MKNIIFFKDTKITNNKKVAIYRKKLNKRKRSNCNLKTNLTFPLHKSILNKVKGVTLYRGCNCSVKELVNTKYIFSKK